MWSGYEPSFLGVSSFFFPPFFVVPFFVFFLAELFWALVAVVLSSFLGVSCAFRPKTAPVGWMSTLAPSTRSALFTRLRREDFVFRGKPSCVFVDMNLLLANVVF